jgi:DMSO/TMAO reductase YedYZ molybdopterin-dependent catalytic subunit/predicted lipoprotein with Yx(FWY)xxD motif
MRKMAFVNWQKWLTAALVLPLLLTSAACAKTGVSPTSGPITVTDTFKTGLGNYLIDANGRTLYWTILDSPGQSNINATALSIWPVFYISDILVPLIPTMATNPPKLLPPLKASDFSSITRADGTKQTTFKGWPLYYYAGDKSAPGTFGQGIDGNWYVVNPQVSAPLPPTVRFSTPFDGDIVPAGNVSVFVDITNFTPVDKIGKANSPGEGHLNFFLDADAPVTPGQPAVLAQGKWVSAADTTYTFTNVPAGTHTVSVELVNNDQTPLARPVVNKITIVVGPPVSYTPAGEIEAAEFQGHELTPISQQNNNALAGTEYIDMSTYTLTIDGLVDHPLVLTYKDLLAYPQISQLMDLNCVEGWDFTAKWTGPALSAIFATAGVKTDAKIAIFHTADVPEGYTSLDLNYINSSGIIIGLKDNDITLPFDRGFPFQVVAMNKYGYKWAKWVTRIELSSDTTFRGYWETNGYDNSGDTFIPNQ